ncbi:Nn.00g032790.m01.CDS01 [Neocucurbitaria sp. VM-36]
MSTPNSTTIPTVTEFLANGITPYHPTDLDSECSICTDSWRDEPHNIVSLPCHHIFHQDCIKTWLTEGTSDTATCPYCRLELCKRYPDPPSDEGFWITVDGEADPDDEFASDLEPDESWEGFDTALGLVRDDLSTIYALTYQIWGENTLVYAELIYKILAAYKADDTRPLHPILPGGAEEYNVVRAIVESLRECLVEQGHEVELMELVLEVFDEFEEHMETRSVEEAYVGAGLPMLVTRNWEEL